MTLRQQPLTTPTDLDILQAINDRQRYTPMLLSYVTDHDKGYISNRLRQLETRGYVHDPLTEHTDHESDTDRSGMYTLTPTGAVAVFHLDGEFHAVLNFCVHQSGPLCEGEFIRGGFTAGADPTIWSFDPDEACISCPWHNWRFDVRSGRSVDDPRYAVPTFETYVEDGDVYVSF
jgi:nitrite reductase/ring-hydroxylating ferredoxin subunit